MTPGARPPDEPKAASAPRGRRRDARINDARILDAALVLAGQEGWQGLRPTRVSAATGLSVPPIRERFADRDALAARLWEERCAAPMMDDLARVIDAVPGPDEAEDSVARRRDDMVSAMQRFTSPDQTMLACSEMLIMARFSPELSGVVDETWQSAGDLWLRPRRGGPSRAQAARRAIAIAEALGLLLVARSLGPAPDLRKVLGALVSAMAVDTSPTRLPAQRAEHLRASAVFRTGDTAWDDLLRAALHEIGRRGYDAATLDVIAHASGHSRGIIANRYSGKKAVFLDATRRMLAAAVVLNEDYLRAIAASHSRGIADAAGLREFMSPDQRLLRSISFEQMRMSWHDSEIADALRGEVLAARDEILRGAPQQREFAVETEWHFGLALGQGSGLLADLYPPAADLPYDVVTVPFNERDLP